MNGIPIAVYVGLPPQIVIGQVQTQESKNFLEPKKCCSLTSNRENATMALEKALLHDEIKGS